jgi:hypothetical protein
VYFFFLIYALLAVVYVSHVMRIDYLIPLVYYSCLSKHHHHQVLFHQSLRRPFLLNYIVLIVIKHLVNQINGALNYCEPMVCLKLVIKYPLIHLMHKKASFMMPMHEGDQRYHCRSFISFNHAFFAGFL